MFFILGRFKQRLAELIGSTLTGWLQYPCIDKIRQDRIEIELEVMPGGNIPAYVIKAQIVIEFLKEKITAVERTLFVQRDT